MRENWNKFWCMGKNKAQLLHEDYNWCVYTYERSQWKGEAQNCNKESRI
jgi:hypothetical protein